MIIHYLAVITGLTAILGPVIQKASTNSRPVGRTIGSGSALRQKPAVAAISAGLILVGVILWIPLPIEIKPALDAILLGLGSLIYFPAIFLYLWGLAALGEQFGVSSARGAELYTNHRLIRTGPYRWIRHPMYLAVLLAAPGALLIFRTWAMLVFTPLSLVVIQRAAIEEALLAEEFPEEWSSYIEEVPPWLPRCYKKR